MSGKSKEVPVLLGTRSGVYRSDNKEEDWIDIGDGKLPRWFGLPIAVYPHEPETFENASIE